MSSTRWAEPSPALDIGLELALLCDALDLLERGAFLFAICEEGALRERLMQQVYEHLQAEEDRDLIVVELSPDQPDLTGQLEEQLRYELPKEKKSTQTAELTRDHPRPPVVFVHTRALADAGMHIDHLPKDDPLRVSVEQARRVLRTLNLQRERLSRLDVPLVFWLSQNALGQVMQHAADVFAVRGGMFYFETPLRAPSAPPPMRVETIVGLLDSFHRTLLPPDELRRRAVLYERRLERERTAQGQDVDVPNWPRIAFLCRDLANIHRELDNHAQAGTFQQEAVEAYQEAIRATDDRETQADLQAWLGNAYRQLPTGDRAQNLARAIQCYQEALTVYTPEAAPLEYAGTQNNLGNAYLNLPTGDRAQNLARAIQCYQEALRFRTPEAAPLEYATTQNNLGIAYSELPTGDRAQNLARAIQCYNNALAVLTINAFPHHHEIVARNLEHALSAQRSPRERLRATLRRILRLFRRSTN
jgi:tetratricopeptide (TPR) repeat protein